MREGGKVGYFIGKIEAILSQFRQAKGKQRWLRFKFNLYAKWWADVILGRVHGPAHLFRSPDPTLRLFPYYYNTRGGARPRHAEGTRRPRGEATIPDKTFPRRQTEPRTRPPERNSALSPPHQTPEIQRHRNEARGNITFAVASSHFGALFILQLVDVCEFIEYWSLLFGAQTRPRFRRRGSSARGAASPLPVMKTNRHHFLHITQ